MMQVLGSLITCDPRSRQQPIFLINPSVNSALNHSADINKLDTEWDGQVDVSHLLV